MTKKISDLSFRVIYKPSTKKGKEIELEEIFKILTKIRNQVAHESPNSATFSLVLDSLEKKGKIISIKEEISKEAIPKFK